MKKIVLLFVLSCFSFTACRSSNSSPTVTPIVIKGSDTEVQLVSNLAEAFTASNSADLSVTGGGSGVGIAGILNNEADVANSSRKMKEEEFAIAQKQGKRIREFVLAYDGLSIIAHPENPQRELTLEQLRDIYVGKIKNWKEVGGKDLPIILYGRQSTSGTFTFFRDTVLKADYDSSLRGLEGSQAIVDAVKADKGGIGYVGLGYVQENGKARTDISLLSLKKDVKAPAQSPLEKKSVEDGSYPLARKIYQYFDAGTVSKKPMLKEFLLFEMSETGRKHIESAGFYPITTEDQQENTSLLEPSS